MSDELRDLYQEVILDHGKNPRNFRHPAEANRSAEGHNPLCGDQIALYLTVDADGVIADAAFEGRGCAISTASASLMTEVVKGRTMAEVKALFDNVHFIATGSGDAYPTPGLEEALERLAALGGVRQYPMRVKCATLPWHTLMAALANRDKASTE